MDGEAGLSKLIYTLSSIVFQYDFFFSLLIPQRQIFHFHVHFRHDTNSVAEYPQYHSMLHSRHLLRSGRFRGEARVATPPAMEVDPEADLATAVIQAVTLQTRHFLHSRYFRVEAHLAPPPALSPIQRQTSQAPSHRPTSQTRPARFLESTAVIVPLAFAPLDGLPSQ